jgi:hypothetical protein
MGALEVEEDVVLVAGDSEGALHSDN